MCPCFTVYGVYLLEMKSCFVMFDICKSSVRADGEYDTGQTFPAFTSFCWNPCKNNHYCQQKLNVSVSLYRHLVWKYIKVDVGARRSVRTSSQVSLGQFMPVGRHCAVKPDQSQVVASFKTDWTVNTGIKVLRCHDRFPSFG